MGREYCSQCGRVGCEGDCEPTYNGICMACGNKRQVVYEGAGYEHYECTECGKTYDKYIELKFHMSYTGFLQNRYKASNGKYYNLQWSNGYDKPPILYTATPSWESDCPVKKEMYDRFIFPEGHEAYGSMLFHSAWEEIKAARALKEES